MMSWQEEEDAAYAFYLIDPAWHCLDCGVHTGQVECEEYYMVSKDLWQSSVKEDEEDGMLCIGCLETRIGRLLTPDDFPPIPVNKWPASDRLRSRQGR